MAKTYLFYDIESTGLNKCFDQVMQFAAIRTDEQFNELERHEILVKLNPDVIPAPGAVVTHRILPEQVAQGLAEDQAMLKIHQLLNTPGTISLGYNTLSFDDEFLRFSFYRNLLPPYTHQYANQCGRMDIYPMLVLYYLYSPDVLSWPQVDGRPSMKLENLGAENGFMEGQAHDAMVDVVATVELAKRLSQHTKMWQYILGYFDKVTDQNRLHKLPALDFAGRVFPYGLYTLPKLGNRNQFQAPVMQLGQHRHYKNQTIWLRLDQESVRKSSLDNIDETTWGLPKKAGEPAILLPYTDHYPQHISEKREKQVQDNIRWLQEHPQVLQAIQDYHLEYKHAVHPQTDVEAGLYQSAFWTPQETRLCQQFHQGSPEAKRNILNQLTNPDLRQLALRLLARHYPAVLSQEERAEYDRFVQQTEVVDFRGEKKLTKEAFYRQADQLEHERALDGAQQNVLNAWRQAF